VRHLALWIAISAAAGCGGSTRFALLPPLQTSVRDPNPTRPLVETQVTPQKSDDGGRSQRSPGVIGSIDTALSGAAVLSWLLGGAAPLIGVYGTFDETTWFQHKPADAPPLAPQP
jgi:hypothetical protein